MSPNGSVPCGITGTRPDTSSLDSSRAPSAGDASRRSPAGMVRTNLTIEECSDAVRSWLLGANGKGLPVNDAVIAEQLRAVAPECYED